MAHNSRRHQRAARKHGDRLVAVNHYLLAMEYCQALEMTQRILRDRHLSSEARVRTKGKEVEALIGLGRTNEAFRAAVELERMLDRFRLERLAEEMEPVIERAKALRGA